MTDIHNIYLIACKNNYIDIIDNINLFDLNKFTINKSLEYIIKNNNIELLNRLYAYDLLEYQDKLLYLDIDNNNINIFEWYHENLGINPDNLIYYAAITKKISILNWFHNNNFDFNLDIYKHCIIDACNKLDFTVVYWFRDNGYLDKFYKKIMKNKYWISEYKLNYHAKAIIDWFSDNYKF